MHVNIDDTVRKVHRALIRKYLLTLALIGGVGGTYSYAVALGSYHSLRGSREIVAGIVGLSIAALGAYLFKVRRPPRTDESAFLIDNALNLQDRIQSALSLSDSPVRSVISSQAEKLFDVRALNAISSFTFTRSQIIFLCSVLIPLGFAIFTNLTRPVAITSEAKDIVALLEGAPALPQEVKEALSDLKEKLDDPLASKDEVEDALKKAESEIDTAEKELKEQKNTPNQKNNRFVEEKGKTPTPSPSTKPS